MVIFWGGLVDGGRLKKADKKGWGESQKAAAVLLVVAHGRRGVVVKIGDAHFRISHILLTQNRNAVREYA